MYKLGLIQIMKTLKLAVYKKDEPFELHGKKTPFGFDVRSTLMCGDTSALVFSIMMKRLMKLQPSHIGGRGEGALLMTAICSVGYQKCRGFVFGEENAILAGRLPKEPGKKVVLVADVLTTGETLKPLADFVAQDHEIVSIVPLVDRLSELLGDGDDPDMLGKYRELVNPILVTADFADMTDGNAG